MAAITQSEFLWREWFLGRERFAKHGARNPSVRWLTGAPPKVPAPWWQRLEVFLAKTDIEPARKVKLRDRIAEPTRRKPAQPGQLSQHFNVSEFNCKDGTRVPEVAVAALKRLAADVLEPMRAKFGSCHVMSGYRPTAYNARIGGARYSQHIYTLTPESVAADQSRVRVPSLPPLEVPANGTFCCPIRRNLSRRGPIRGPRSVEQSACK